MIRHVVLYVCVVHMYMWAKMSIRTYIIFEFVSEFVHKNRISKYRNPRVESSFPFLQIVNGLRV